MVDTPIEPPRAIAPLPAVIAPVLRHGGWLGFFLMLAPVIGPRGYGLFIIALSGIAIAEALLAETFIHALTAMEVVEGRHWSTALVTMIAAGAGVSLMLHVATGPVSVAFGEPMLGDMFRSLAMLPLLGALTVVPSAALRREGRPVAIVAASAAGLAAGGGIALSLAWAGAGPWSLVAQIIVQRLVECAVLWATPGERIGLAWSERHFTELVDAVDARALAAAWPAIRRYTPCLLVGWVLGPTATGLYMFAAYLAEALADLCLVGKGNARDEIMTRACRVMLPTVLASTLLAIALPPLLDLRWWGAVLPAQILLLGAIPGAIIFARVASAECRPAELWWQALQAVGGIALVALVAPLGLVAIATASLSWTMIMAAARVRLLRQELGAGWPAALAGAVRPCAATAVAGIVLFILADPVGLVLATAPALCLLSALGWLIYLVIRGGPVDEAQPRRFSPKIITVVNQDMRG